MIYLGSIVILISVSTLMFHYLLFVLGLFRFALNWFVLFWVFIFLFFYLYLVCLFVCFSAWIKWDMIFFCNICMAFLVAMAKSCIFYFSSFNDEVLLGLSQAYLCLYLSIFSVGQVFLHLLDKCQVPGIFRY